MTQDDPLKLFSEALARAHTTEATDPTAMTLATVDATGRPTARVVLLKELAPRGFVFYTNRSSRKGRELAQDTRAALCVHWARALQQVRIDGRVELVTDTESDAYFATRPRGSQIAAWASEQSEPIDSREALEARVVALEGRYQGIDVPRPPHWGGYVVVPDSIEFWWGRESRLHDRLLYERAGGGWRVTRLQP